MYCAICFARVYTSGILPTCILYLKECAAFVLFQISEIYTHLYIFPRIYILYKSLIFPRNTDTLKSRLLQNVCTSSKTWTPFSTLGIIPCPISTTLMFPRHHLRSANEKVFIFISYANNIVFFIYISAFPDFRNLFWIFTWKRISKRWNVAFFFTLWGFDKFWFIYSPVDSNVTIHIINDTIKVTCELSSWICLPFLRLSAFLFLFFRTSDTGTGRRK